MAPPRKILTKPARVPRCGTHGKHRPGCRPCLDWSAYDQRLRRWEQQEGISRANMDAEPVREHLEHLLRDGNYKIVDLARISGIPKLSLWAIRNGRRRYVFQITGETILAIKPRVGVRPPKEGMVRAAEGVRILRGLSAQGWSFPFIGELMGNHTRTAVQKLAAYDLDRWMFPETLDRLRIVADKLGRYDITDLDKPMIGMDIRCANYAARRNWAPLRDWDGLDIADPDAEPHHAEELNVPGRVHVDLDTLRVHIALIAERDGAFPDPLRSITRLEAYAAVWLAQEAGLSAADTGALLGYPQGTSKDRTNGQRQATRLRSHMIAARRWLTDEPDGNTPAWLTVTGDYRNEMAQSIPALLAVQPEPFGYGMTPADLAERFGADVTEEEVRACLSRAAAVADRRWTPGARPRRAGPRPTTTAGRAAQAQANRAA